ncbi:MAG: hypothetical protein RL653_173 [Pseudomonadota bacterium]
MRLTQLPTTNATTTPKPVDTKPTTNTPGTTGATGAITPKTNKPTETAPVATTPAVGQAQSRFEANIDININININFGGTGATQPGMVSPPSQDQAAASAGQGLEKNPEGWPEGSVRTAGGYTIVPEGKDAAFKIYGPNQSPSDEAMTRVWGDPHVSEKDGTKWDFTKDSNFRLPDGTVISVDTTSQTGQSVSQKLDIVNGDDHVAINGINTDKPSVGDIQAGGQAWLDKNAKGRVDFRLGDTGSADDVKWFREKNGEVEGLITGAKQDAEKTYDQVLDTNQKDVGGTGQAAEGAVGGERPAFGSDDWKNQFEGMLSKMLEELFGTLLNGRMGAADEAAPADAAGDVQAANEAATENDAQPTNDNGFGGLEATGGKDAFQDALQAIQMLAQLFQSLSSLFTGMGGQQKDAPAGV